jgi:hypothetical protein
MLCKEVIALCFENRTPCKQIAEVFHAEAAGGYKKTLL